IAFEKTNPDPIPSDVTISYEIPHLPFDSELRRSAFDTYGFFDQAKNANHPDSFDSNGHQSFFESNNTAFGYEVFKNTSKLISDMRGGVDVYRKVQFLI